MDDTGQQGQPAPKPLLFGQTLLTPDTNAPPTPPLVTTGQNADDATNAQTAAANQTPPQQPTLVQSLQSAIAPDIVPPQAKPNQIGQIAEFTEADRAELMDAARVNYVSTPVNLHMGRWEFKESKLSLDPDEAVEFEKLLADQPIYVQIWVKKADSTLSAALAKKVLQSSLVQGMNTTANMERPPSPEGT